MTILRLHMVDFLSLFFTQFDIGTANCILISWASSPRVWLGISHLWIPSSLLYSQVTLCLRIQHCLILDNVWLSLTWSVQDDATLALHHCIGPSAPRLILPFSLAWSIAAKWCQYFTILLIEPYITLHHPYAFMCSSCLNCWLDQVASIMMPSKNNT